MGFVGSAIGAVTGALGGGGGGGFQAEAPKLIEHNYLQDLGNALTPLTNGLSSATNTGTRQKSLADMLEEQSRGGGPSVAQNQLQAATDRTGQQAAGLIASQRGLNPALAARQVLQQQASANQAAANQSAQLRAQEMLNARQLLGQNLASQRSQDIGQYQAAGDVANVIGTLQNNQNANRNNGASAANQTNAQMAGTSASMGKDLLGGIAGGISTALPGIGKMISPLFASKPPAANSAGGNFGGGSTMVAAQGGKVPGQPEVSGDSPKNDKVPAWLSPGEIVIPRSIAHDPDAARDFVAKVNAKKYSDGGAVEEGPITLDPDKVAKFKKGFKFSEGGEAVEEMTYYGAGTKEYDEGTENNIRKSIHDTAEKQRRYGKYPKGEHTSPDPKEKSERTNWAHEYNEGGEVKQTNSQMSKEFMSALKEHYEPGPKGFSKVLETRRRHGKN